MVPCYRECNKILGTLARIPDLVNRIYCVDDGCPDQTGDYVEENCNDKRVRVLRHKSNQGVGGAMVTGYRQAMHDNADIVVKIDGDGQMNPESIMRFVRPIALGQADYTKGNRYFLLHNLDRMPKRRVFGNAALSFLSKLSTGYWRNFDPANGYTAIHARVLCLLPLYKVHRGYFFESDMLFHLSTLRGVVQDIPERAVYRDEQSNLRVSKVIPLFAIKHLRNFSARIFYTYFLRDFHLASIEWFLGPPLLIFGTWFGISSWQESTLTGIEATAGTVMLAGLPFIIGLQLLLSAIGFDIDNQPRTALHTLLD